MKDISPTQRLILFNLLFTGDKPAMSKTKPKLEPKERDQLVHAGLIRLEKMRNEKNRPYQAIVLEEEQAFEWAAETLGGGMKESRPTGAGIVLDSVLTHLNRFLVSHSLTLADFMAGTPSEDGPAIMDSGAVAASEAAPEMNGISMPEKVRAAYLALSGGWHRKAIRLADLKASIKDADPEKLDRTLLDMQNAGELSLQPIENPQQVTDADHSAAIRILGQERHLVYLER